MSIDLTTASKDELREYARETHGINLPPNASEQTMRDRIQELEGGDALPPQAEAVAPRRRARATPAQPAEKRIVINIHRTQGKTGRQDVFVSVNNRDYLIKRGVDVAVPPEVVHVLQNAIEDVFEYDQEARDVTKREVHAYPFTIVSSTG